MAFERPTLDQIQQRAYADFRAELPGDEPTIQLTTEYAFVAAVAGMSHLKHGRISYAMRQQFPDTADSEGLDHWASVWGVPRQQPQIASGTVTATGVAASSIPAGTQISSPQDDLTYEVAATTVIGAGGDASVPVNASAPGSAYNKQIKTILQFTSPPAGVDSEVVVEGIAVNDGIQGGTDLESDELLRSRVLARIQGGKLIGKPGDWEHWALEVSGVTRAWESAGFLGAGSVGVFFLVDDNPISAIPSPGVVSTVQAYLDQESPIAYTNVAVAPADQQLAVTVNLDPDTADIRTAVEEEIADMLLREATPLGFTLTTVVVEQTIARAVGTGSFMLTNPNIDITYTLGNMPITFAMTYT